MLDLLGIMESGLDVKPDVHSFIFHFILIKIIVDSLVIKPEYTLFGKHTFTPSFI